MLDSIPHPLTTNHVQQIESSPNVDELHPEVVASRLSDGEVIPAFLLKTNTTVCAIVENAEQNGYQVLSKGDLTEEDEVYSDLQSWCEEHSYHETVH